MKKFLIISIFLISSFFIWQYINRYLTPSKAGQETVRVFFENQNVTTNQDGAIEVNIFFTTKTNPPARISAATISLKYPHSLLEYVNTPEGQAKTDCFTNNFRLTKLTKVENMPLTDDSTYSRLTITRLSQEKDENLPYGLLCFGTITFKPRSPGSGVISFYDQPNFWEIVGPENTYAYQINQEKNQVNFTITPFLTPAPTFVSTPTKKPTSPTPTPTSKPLTPKPSPTIIPSPRKIPSPLPKKSLVPKVSPTIRFPFHLP